MLRVRIPGGVLTPEQWLALDRVARGLRQRYDAADHAADRAASRCHQVEPQIDAEGDRPDAAQHHCGGGDVNRNVMCNPNPGQSRTQGGRWNSPARSPTI